VDLSEILSTPAGLAIEAMLAAAFLDFAFGVFASARDGSFQMDQLAAFARKHLMGRVFPISTLLVIGYFSGDAGMPMTAAGGAAAAAYAAETLASIYSSIKPTSDVNKNPTPQG